MPQPLPSTIGLKRSFGFGDLLGKATPGHILAIRKSSFIPLFAEYDGQASFRNPTATLASAQEGLNSSVFASAWGAEAANLQTEQEVREAALAGYTYFSFNPSSQVNLAADRLQGSALIGAVESLLAERHFQNADWPEDYLNDCWHITPGLHICFDQETLFRKAVKFVKALRHCETLHKTLASICQERRFEVEVDLSTLPEPTTTFEHVFVTTELKKRKIKVAGFAPRFIGQIERGADYAGDLKAFEKNLGEHVEIAAFCGPYKISFPAGDNLASIWPLVGSLCKNALHLKSREASYIEALRVVCRTDRELFEEICEVAKKNFSIVAAHEKISTSDADVQNLQTKTGSDVEKIYLGSRTGRQLLQVTAPAILQSAGPSGRNLRDAIIEILDREAHLYTELLDKHFSRQLQQLSPA